MHTDHEFDGVFRDASELPEQYRAEAQADKHYKAGEPMRLSRWNGRAFVMRHLGTVPGVASAWGTPLSV